MYASLYEAEGMAMVVKNDLDILLNSWMPDTKDMKESKDSLRRRKDSKGSRKEKIKCGSSENKPRGDLEKFDEQEKDSNVDEPKGVRRRELFARTQMCAFQLAGTCTRGAKCTYAHSDHELSRCPDLYKTALCSKFVAGQCTDIDCTYAHGIHELRSAPETFKTSICRYFQKGDCKLGKHCRYSHCPSKLQKSRQLEEFWADLLAMRKQHEEEFREQLSKEKALLRKAVDELTVQLHQGNEVPESVLSQLARYSRDTKQLFEVHSIGASSSLSVSTTTPRVGKLYTTPHVPSWPTITDNENVLTSSEWDNDEGLRSPMFLDSSTLEGMDKSPMHIWPQKLQEWQKKNGDQ